MSAWRKDVHSCLGYLCKGQKGYWPHVLSKAVFGGLKEKEEGWKHREGLGECVGE